MRREESTSFLFRVANEVKRSFESPVILLTKNDYAKCIFKSLVDIRSALIAEETPNSLINIISTFHFEWIQAIHEVEKFKKDVDKKPRETIFDAIDYTVEHMEQRQQVFERYIRNLMKTFTKAEQKLMETDINIINDMKEIVNYALLDKQRSLLNQADKDDFKIIIDNEVDELMHWLDILYKHLAIQFTKVIKGTVAIEPEDLAAILQDVIEEVIYSKNTDITVEVIKKPEKFGSTLCLNSMTDIEIEKIIKQIQGLEYRIDHLKILNSSTMALEHKTVYLEDRLRALENLKLALNKLREHKIIDTSSETHKTEYNIFNHLLPHPYRCRLVERFIHIWKVSLGGDTKAGSWLSLFNPSDRHGVFCDSIGQFCVDKYGRKIYTIPGDEQMYQIDDNDDLVAVNDDPDHIYYYDECGRYYINENGTRVYKAHHNASEYVFDKACLLVKLGEVVDGVAYFYDNLGRYYKDAEGNHIYREKKSNEEYINDGMGNLVRIRSEFTFKMCELEPMVMEESFYLKNAVGDALIKCLSDAILVQPADPVRYLADRLIQYHKCLEFKKNNVSEVAEFLAARSQHVPSSTESLPIPESISCIYAESLGEQSRTD